MCVCVGVSIQVRVCVVCVCGYRHACLYVCVCAHLCVCVWMYAFLHCSSDVCTTCLFDLPKIYAYMSIQGVFGVGKLASGESLDQLMQKSKDSFVQQGSRGDDSFTPSKAQRLGTFRGRAEGLFEEGLSAFGIWLAYQPCMFDGHSCHRICPVLQFSRLEGTSVVDVFGS